MSLPFDEIISWLEDHGSTVSAIGIISSFVLFILQKWIQDRSDNITYLVQKEAYLYDLADELVTITQLLESPQIRESESDIFDLTFPSEAYEKIPLETQHLEQGSLPTIRDYYHTIRQRNKLYYHRLEVKHSFFTPDGINNQAWCNFISELDKKIKEYEDFMRTFNEDVVDTVDRNLKHTSEIKKSIRTRWNIFPKSF
jgi:hypothetical protein